MTENTKPENNSTKEEKKLAGFNIDFVENGYILNMNYKMVPEKAFDFGTNSLQYVYTSLNKLLKDLKDTVKKKDA
ncbi:MAG: hypothetical protein Q7R56_03205 [Nanoarchaeota archaeon]|nr:hypothetical protein [Nanoarchaeota archaeon]